MLVSAKLRRGLLLSLAGALAACQGLLGSGEETDSSGDTESSGGGGEECETLGAKSCEAGNALVELTCVEDEAGRKVHEQSPCEEGHECIEGQGCTACVDICVAGELRCSVDPPNFVVSCEQASPGGCAIFVLSLDCAMAGLSTCVAPPEPVSDIQEYCVNECGERNVPLDHSVCDQHDSIGCAVWVCDPDTQMLVPDHTACFQGGAPCVTDSECVSCSCQEGICIGNDVNSCNPAC